MTQPQGKDSLNSVGKVWGYVYRFCFMWQDHGSSSLLCHFPGRDTDSQRNMTCLTPHTSKVAPVPGPGEEAGCRQVCHAAAGQTWPWYICIQLTSLLTVFWLCSQILRHLKVYIPIPPRPLLRSFFFPSLWYWGLNSALLQKTGL
jgi:hypothetical protein